MEILANKYGKQQVAEASMLLHKKHLHSSIESSIKTLYMLLWEATCKTENVKFAGEIIAQIARNSEYVLNLNAIEKTRLSRQENER